MNKITRVLLVSFLTNISLSLIKIITGLISASGALIADGMHSFSDTLTDVFSMAGHKLSMKPADYKHPFGHGKIEYITCIFIGFVVILMGITVIYKGIFEGSIIPSAYAAVVGIIVIIAKILLANFILNRGEKYKSNILMASGKESFADVISSLIVLISIVISQLGHFNSIFVYADMVAMIIVGILILRIGFKIIRENFSELLGEQITDEDYLGKIEKIILKETKVKSIDKLIIVKYGISYQVNCEVSMDKNLILKDVHHSLDKIEQKLKKFDNKLVYITIHVNPL